MAPPAEPGGGPAGSVVSLAVPEIRDYRQVNALIIQALDSGAGLVRLVGVEGQRLLAAGLVGPWRAIVEIQGDAGPEVAAELDAPGLRVVVGGSAADGAGRGLRAGALLVLRTTGDCLGYTQRGGLIVICGPQGPRAGLDMAGGTLLIGGGGGRLVGERQRGGLILLRDMPGPHAGIGRSGGRRVVLGTEGAEIADEQAACDAVGTFADRLPAGFPRFDP